MVPALEMLIQASLMREQEEDGAARGSVMLETIREYVQERLQESEEAEKLRRCQGRVLSSVRHHRL